MDRHPLLSEIDAYAAASGLEPTTVCVRAVNNAHLYQRLVDGGDCTIGVARRVRRHFAENPPETARRRRTAASSGSAA